MAFAWTVTPGQAFGELAQHVKQVSMLSGVRAVERRAPEAEQWMKSNAPWTDRTGRARAGLHVEVKDSPGVLTEMIFSHDPDLDYTVWLEIANGGRFGIISQAVDVWGPILMRDVQRIINLGLATKG